MRQDTYIVTLLLLLAMVFCPEAEAADYQAEVDLGDNSHEFLQMMFNQLELLGNQNHNETKQLLKEHQHTQLASALLRVAPVITIKGNITDPTRSLTVTFIVHASRHHHGDHNLDLENGHRVVGGHHDERAGLMRGGGGILSPIVGLVEPYVLGLAELLVNSILSTAISNFLEGTTLSGDVRLV